METSFIFWGFIASAFIGFANTSAKHPIFAIVICCFGFICSLSWTLVNRGSKYWYENWENKVKKLGGDEIKKLFEEKEPNTKVGLWTAQRFSVSRISIALSE